MAMSAGADRMLGQVGVQSGLAQAAVFVLLGGPDAAVVGDREDAGTDE
jgi:hypothetical protein